MAGEDPRPANLAGERLEIGVRPDQSEVAGDEQAGRLRLLELGEHDHAPGGDRAAFVDERPLAAQRRELGRRLGHRPLARPVEHEPQRAVCVVVGDEDHAPAEVRVGQGRLGDEHLSLERVHVESTRGPPSPGGNGPQRLAT